jgi:hypothetical protein
MYQVVLPHALAPAIPGTATFDFTDISLTLRPEDVTGTYDVVVLGGGTIMTPSNLQRVRELLKDFVGRIYAYSVDFVGSEESMRLFDHVFVRNATDFQRVRAVIGSRNVTLMPDATMFLSKAAAAAAAAAESGRSSRDGISKIGIFLTRGAAMTSSKLIQTLADQLVALVDSRMDPIFGIDIAMLESAGSGPSLPSTILELAQTLRAALGSGRTTITTLGPEGHNREFDVVVAKPMDMFNYMNTLDVVVTTDYHAACFAMSLAKPLVVILTADSAASGMTNLVLDYSPWIQAAIPEDRMSTSLRGVLHEILDANNSGDQSQQQQRPAATHNFADAGHLVFEAKKVASIMRVQAPLDDIVLNVSGILKSLLSLPSVDLSLPGLCSVLDLDARTFLADLIFFFVTRKSSAPTLLKSELIENLAQPSFVVLDSLVAMHDAQVQEEEYFGNSTLPIRRRVFADILDMDLADDYSAYHRSGWAYALSGMIAFDAGKYLRESSLLLDSYLDRTFHWAHDVLLASGVIPFRRPWIGIIHHTFDETHSKWNSSALFRNQAFLDSLRTSCRGLIALTKTLAAEIRVALATVGLASSRVPVYVLDHPMESVPSNFSMSAFLANKERKLVQIGAWMRRPYGIYALQLPAQDEREFEIQKAALRGFNMDGYFKPPALIAQLSQFLSAFPIDSGGSQGICRPPICRPMLMSSFAAPDSSTLALNPDLPPPEIPAVNKYCLGLQDLIQTNDASVSILEHLTNDEYDELLSKNLVFLNLIDCSAVNTVLECVVRGTPIFVNRLPALEEVLGADYPGFYRDFADAEDKVGKVSVVEACHLHLVGLDKFRYRLDVVMDRLQDIILAAASSL